jgi:poly(3-hydroxybutyrate) depolymerase
MVATFAVFTFVWIAAPLRAGERKKVLVNSTLDGVPQTCYIIEPEGFAPSHGPVPLVVALHSWSAGVEQRNVDREAAAERRGWLYLSPDFRGANVRPEACGSLKAQQDILDAVTWTLERYPVDRRRIYLTGVSGGGHMTMLMAGRHPELWAAASAWVGISDLATWHQAHVDDNYGAMLRACCGGSPGERAAVDEEYRQRSPLTHLHRAAGLPLDLAAGVHDGHQGSVPVKHSLDAFNVVANAVGAPLVTAAEIAQISRPNGRLDHPKDGDELYDPVFGRRIYLRRMAGPCRISIFEGGHECVAEAAIEWLARHAKPE